MKITDKHKKICAFKHIVHIRMFLYVLFNYIIKLGAFKLLLLYIIIVDVKHYILKINIREIHKNL